MSGALEGVKVLDVGQLVQGPQAAALFSDMGASVIKVELPGIGDQARYLTIGPEDSRSGYFTACNRGKRGVTIDLRVPSGAEVFKRLVRDTDVLVSNFKAGTMEEWGLGYADLKADNPGLIWAAGSAFGPVGPDAPREGADLAGQCAGGLVSTIGFDGERMAPVGVTIADHIASQHLAAGVLAALVARGRTGLGQSVEVSLLGGQIWAQASEYSHHLMSGDIPGRSNGGHPLIRGLYGVFETGDGWLGLIGVPPAAKDAFFLALDKPELALDERFQTLIIEPEALKYLRGIVASVFKTDSTESWCARLREMGVRYAPVRNYAEAVADPGSWENGYFQEVADESGELHRVVGTPIRMSDTPLKPAALPPQLGEHTDEVLTELGYSSAELAELRGNGAI